jgi:hypothetical protein
MAKPLTLALYAWPKPFTDPHISIIQRNGIRSWLQLHPRPEVFLFGNEDGIADACRELGAVHVKDCPPVTDGVPKVRDLAIITEGLSGASFFGYVNADIILTQSLMTALRAAGNSHSRFLLGASPWNTSVPDLLDFGPDWEEKMRRRAREANDLRGRAAADFLIYPRGFLQGAPEVLAGRRYVDNGLLWYARHRRAALIDGTPGIFAVHQDHRRGARSVTHGDGITGVNWNRKAIGGDRHLFTWSNATHHYTNSGLKPYFTGRISIWPTHPRIRRRNSTLQLLASSMVSIRKLLGIKSARG